MGRGNSGKITTAATARARAQSSSGTPSGGPTAASTGAGEPRAAGGAAGGPLRPLEPALLEGGHDRAEAAREQGQREFRYQHKRTGAKVIADFRRLLETGDMSKLTPGLYKTLSLHGGFIAHFNIDGFRHTFDGQLTNLIGGEAHCLTDANDVLYPALNDSGYSDDMSAHEVMQGIVEVARELEPVVRERERQAAQQQRLAVLHALAEQEGYTLTKE